MTPDALSPHDAETMPSPTPLLVVVEGLYDIDFLRRLSALLHAHLPHLPDLDRLEQEGQVLFIPMGGGNLRQWTHRLAPLGHPEFHLYDREVPPLTHERHEAAEAVNRRPRCVAALTRMRALENYLHPDAIREARGLELHFDGDTDVPELLARQIWRGHGGADWDGLSWRSRRRLRYQAKKSLNTTAVRQMTLERLVERDPQGEVIGWLRSIAHLMAG